jgi:transposase InsO family protein
VGDITYVPVAGRWQYLSVVMDQYSRRVLAWRLSRTPDAQLTRATLAAAVRRRRPRPGLIFHSDRGSEYAAARFRDRLLSLRILQSTTRGGSPGEKG